MAIISMNFRSTCISRSVYPTVFLPDLNGWQDIQPPYPTLYFLNGYSGGGLETSQFTNFALFSMVHGLAIVLIDGENSFYVDDEKRGAMFSEYTGSEIVAATRAVFPLSSKREDTFIGGISMGGYGAVVNGLRYKSTFGKIACLSPALNINVADEKPGKSSPIPKGELRDIFGSWDSCKGTYKDYMAMTDLALKDKQTMPRIFVACGDNDSLVLENSREFGKRIEENGMGRYYEASGGHDHEFWKKALTPACKFLMEGRA